LRERKERREEKKRQRREGEYILITRNERKVLAWFKTCIWKLRGMRRGLEKGRCYDRKRRTGANNFCVVNALNINGDVASKRIISCTNVVELRKIGRYLYKTRCKWENKVRNT
jgi:hypothetical protein